MQCGVDAPESLKLPRECLLWTNLEAWEIFSACRNDAGIVVRGRTGLHRHGGAQRQAIEDLVAKVFGPGWHQLASQKELWRKRVVQLQKHHGCTLSTFTVAARAPRIEAGICFCIT